VSEVATGDYFVLRKALKGAQVEFYCIGAKARNRTHCLGENVSLSIVKEIASTDG